MAGTIEGGFSGKRAAEIVGRRVVSPYAGAASFTPSPYLVPAAAAAATASFRSPAGTTATAGKASGFSR